LDNTSNIRKPTEKICAILLFIFNKLKETIMKNNIKLICLSAILTLSNSVFAQSNKFEGLSVFTGVGYTAFNSDTKNWKTAAALADPTYSYDSFESGGQPLNLGFEYTIAIDNQFLVGLGMEANLLEGRSGGGSAYRGSVKDGGNLTAQVRSGAYQFSVTPGMIVAPNTLWYGKVGYYSLTTDVSQAGASIGSFVSNGYVLGTGLKQMLSKNIFIFGEFDTRIGISKTQEARDGRTVDLKMEGTSALVGGGLKF
jgi:hypothetical protein